MGKFLWTTVKRTQNFIQMRTVLSSDQTVLWMRKRRYTLHLLPHTQTLTALVVRSVELQAVQGDPLLSRLPLLSRWKCWGAEGLNVAAVYSPAEEVQGAGSSWEAERLRSSLHLKWRAEHTGQGVSILPTNSCLKGAKTGSKSLYRKILLSFKVLLQPVQCWDLEWFKLELRSGNLCFKLSVISIIII